MSTPSLPPYEPHHVGLHAEEKRRLWLKVMEGREASVKNSPRPSVRTCDSSSDLRSKFQSEIKPGIKYGPCTADNDHEHGWRPHTLRAPILLTFAFTSLIIAVIIEVLAQRSQKLGGLALSDSPKSLTSPRVFILTLIPTIVSLIYGLCWSWIDLDVKRMQPWIELSKEDGSTAADSLFSDYNYDFVPLVPFKSAKKRHWLVCLASTAMIMILWVITPLQSAILQTGPVNITEQVIFSEKTNLMPAIDQGVVLDQSVLNAAFAITWLNQPYPAYITSKYALLPFATKAIDAHAGSATNWTGTAYKLTSDLNCWESTVAAANKVSYNFTNGRGCSFNGLAVSSSATAQQPYQMQYIGYHNSDWADYFLESKACSKDSSHQFLAVWSKYITQEKKDITAMWCETNYSKQNVSITVSLPNYVPIESSIKELAPREELTDTEFNRTAFEYLLGSGVSMVKMQRDRPASQLVEQYPRLINSGMAWPVSPMVGFAVGGQKQALGDYSDPNQLIKAYKAAQKVLFSMAIKQTLSNATRESQGTGTIHKLKYGITVNRPFSIAVESLLVAVAFLAFGLLWRCSAADNKLINDPASIASMMDIAKESPDFLNEFVGKGSLHDEALRDSLKNQVFRLRCGCEDRSGFMTLGVLDKPGASCARIKQELVLDEEITRTGYYDPIKPIALRKDVGSGFVVSLAAMIIVLSVLRIKEQQLGGLVRPSENPEVLQLLENYIPTVLATLIEPFWVLLNRFLCLLQPFKDMVDRERQESGSAYSTYTSIPPQLAIFQALRSRHFLLSGICIVALLTNVLVIGFAGLFNDLPTEVSYPTESRPLTSSQINNASLSEFVDFAVGWTDRRYEDHFYVALANLTSNTTLPPWISSEYSFQAFQASSGSVDNTTVTFQASTRGFSVSPRCLTMVSSTQPPSLDFRAFKRDNNLTGIVNCTDIFHPDTMMLNQSQVPPCGKSAIEVNDQLMSYRGLNPCQKFFIAGWGRTPKGEDPEGSVETSFVACYPQFQTAMFDLRVDGSGYVKSYNRTSEFESNLGYPASQNHTDTLINLNNQLFLKSHPDWHNDSLTRSWLDHYIKLEMQSDAIVDPNSPVPVAQDVLPIVEDVYRRLFAILLGLNSNIFETSDASTFIRGSRISKETRIFISDSAFIICMAILVLDLFAGIIFYGVATKMFLPRLPTTIGSIFAYLAPSRAVREFNSGKLMSFGFGRFIGEDGRAHIGIEMDHLVVPVEVSALRNGNNIFMDESIKTTETE